MFNGKTVGCETICWEKDWEFMLNTRRLSLMFERNNFDFDKRVLFINNVNDEKKVRKTADKHIASGLLTEYYLVSEHIEAALDFFKLTRQELEPSYHYSTAEFVSLYLDLFDYTLHFCGDSIPREPTTWIPQSLEAMQDNSNYKMANLMWDTPGFEDNLETVKKQSYEETETFYIGYGFSDQCYLIKNEDFRAPIYHEPLHPDTLRFPIYGQDGFEARVNSWMQNHGFLRLTFKNGVYVHRNFPNHPLKRAAYKWSGYYNR